MTASEVDLDADLVSALLGAQVPALAGMAVHSPVSGWDNVVYRLGEDLAVRLPRREASAELAVNEQRWLPEFAARVRLPIPAPIYAGTPGSGYPWSWSVIPWTEGMSLTEAPVYGRAAVAAEVAEFITGSHLSGVIDFGDLTAGDPATDLAVAWLAFNAEDRAVFEADLPSAYRDDAALRTRSKGWALVLATAFAAHSDDNPTMADVGRHAVAQLLDD